MAIARVLECIQPKFLTGCCACPLFCALCNILQEDKSASVEGGEEEKPVPVQARLLLCGVQGVEGASQDSSEPADVSSKSKQYCSSSHPYYYNGYCHVCPQSRPVYLSDGSCDYQEDASISDGYGHDEIGPGLRREGGRRRGYIYIYIFPRRWKRHRLVALSAPEACLCLPQTILKQ